MVTEEEKGTSKLNKEEKKKQEIKKQNTNWLHIISTMEELNEWRLWWWRNYTTKKRLPNKQKNHNNKIAYAYNGRKESKKKGQNQGKRHLEERSKKCKERRTIERTHKKYKKNAEQTKKKMGT